jgi:hypothetical protein
MGHDEITALLPIWQRRLRLNDWDIKLTFEKHPNSLGNVRLQANYKNAEIVLQHTDFIDNQGLGNKDPEVTLVHELLHVQAGELTSFLCARDNERYYDDMERLVELTAIALVDLARRVPKAA